MKGDAVVRVDGAVEVRIPRGTYSDAAVLRAVHRSTAGCFVQVEHEEPGTSVVQLRERRPGTDLERAGRQLLNDLLDEALREQVAAATEPVRHLILAQAFSKVNLLHPELDGQPGSGQAPPPPTAPPGDPHRAAHH